LGLCQALSDRHREWHYLTGKGNYFTLSFKESCMFTGKAPDMPPPTGRELKMDLLFLFRLKDGKLAEAWYKGTTTGLN
jgi:hypothetical protein